MFGEPSDFSPLDLLGSLGLNVAATHTAVKRGNGEFRMGIKVKGEVPAYTDYRFLIGAGAAIGAQFAQGHMTRRVGHDIASGLLNSYVATETMRQIGKTEQAIIQSEMSAQRQLPAPPVDVPANAPAVPVDAEGMGYDFGW